MITRVCLAAVLLSLPAAHAADLAIRAVVVKSARISAQTPHRIGLATTPGTESLRVTLVPEDAGMRLVFTP